MGTEAPRVHRDNNSHDPLRRTLLLTFVFGYAAASMPRAVAASADDAGYKAFMTVSYYLTGHPSLDASQAARAFDALSQDNQNFGEQVQSLNKLIVDRQIDPMQLQGVLEADKSPLQAIPRKIATAWFLGVVGDGEQARCIAFENNLMNIAIKDKLAPPSYCFGPYGSWTQKPV